MSAVEPSRNGWLWVRAAVDDPHGEPADALRRRLPGIQAPWAVSDEALPEAARLAFAAAWELRRRETLPELRPMAAVAAGYAARLRLVETLAWLTDRDEPLPVLPHLVKTLWAVTRLDADLLPKDGDPVVREAINVLELVRRYGPDEADIQRRLAVAIGSLAPGDDEDVRWWLVAQVNLVAAWVALGRGSADAARALVGRCRLASDSWPGWFALDRRDVETARYRAYQASANAERTRLSLAVGAPLRGGPAADHPAVGWWRQEAAGWRQVASGERSPAAVLAVRPAILSAS